MRAELRHFYYRVDPLPACCDGCDARVGRYYTDDYSRLCAPCYEQQLAQAQQRAERDVKVRQHTARIKALRLRRRYQRQQGAHR